ncbi:hypothetical protein E2C01_061463 [Portunus trituberculatus]|uniref:Fanconi anemia core complex-associated protein 24 n=1 Tax=Portunus trituberculatus TaxID=210409 RepID=A0A5B7H5A5_PORTR|nr:hypothetical protein [Portunus trituberculatus]
MFCNKSLIPLHLRFISIDLGLPIVPVQSLQEVGVWVSCVEAIPLNPTKTQDPSAWTPKHSFPQTAQLLVRMVASETKIRCNPLCKQPQKAGNQDQQLLQSLTSVVPCLGMQRARALLARFGTLQDLAQAPRTAMEEVVGRAAAASVHEFLNGRA